MNLFNNIIIDKIKMLYRKGLVSPEERTLINDTIKEYYNTRPSQSKGWISYEFNPAKQKLPNCNKNHNLQMPEESLLYEALANITLNKEKFQKEVKLTRLDLCEDFLLSTPVSEVLEMLTKCTFPYGKTPKTEQTDDENVSTVYLESAHKNPDSDSEGTLIIRFYDKVAEYYSKYNTYILPLKSSLSEDEILMLGDAYNKETNTVYLENLNILRIEIELHQSIRLKPIAKELTGFYQDYLSIRHLLEAITRNCLYKKLDIIYKKILKKYVFQHNQAFQIKEPKKISGIRELSVKLLSQSANCYKYKIAAMNRGKNPNNNFNAISKLARVEKSNSELYQEVYNEIFKNYNPTIFNDENIICDFLLV